jgi:SAM-dependent methyltransferase
MPEYRARDEHVDLERARLGQLSSAADRGSSRTLTELGLTAGWSCLEVGAGNGSLARWMASVVRPDGRVVATDVDDRFVGDLAADGVEFRVHDITSGPPGDAAFDLAHARAVLEHIPARHQALANIVAAVRPGGLVVIEDIDWHHFDAQPMPEEFGAVHRALRQAATGGYGYDPHFGGRLQIALADAGLVDVGLRAKVSLMRGGRPSAEWYVGALERAVPGLVDAGHITQIQADVSMTQGRDPAFCLQSPVQVSAWGRRPV